MKRNRCFLIYLGLCLIGLVVAFIIGVQVGREKNKTYAVKPRLQKWNDPGLVIQTTQLATGHRLSRETDEAQNDASAAEMEGRTRPRFKTGYWHKHTRSVCKTLRIDTAITEGAIMITALVDDKHKLIFCPIAKAGSSYLGKVVAVLLGQHPTDDPTDVSTRLLYREYMGRQPKLSWATYEENLKKLQTYYSAIVVREPFGRLLSAYRNKIERPKSDLYAKRALHIRGYRNGTTSFAEFVAHVVNAEGDKDRHWRPYYETCSPCAMDYDFVAKMETMVEDFKHIYEEVNVSKIIVPPPAIKKRKADSYLEKYYKQVPNDYLWKLYAKYEPDFLIFKYSVPKVIRNMM